MATNAIKPIITWVNDKPSASGKTVKVLLMHSDFKQGVSHFAYIPVACNPQKWDVIEAETVKIGDVETDYEDITTGAIVELKVPRAQVSFFGSVALVDGDELPATTWVDKRTKRANTVQDDSDAF